jgi:hypothetical protein
MTMVLTCPTSLIYIRTFSIITEHKIHNVLKANVFWMIKSRMRWTGHASCIGEGRGTYGVLVGKP